MFVRVVCVSASVQEPKFRAVAHVWHDPHLTVDSETVEVWARGEGMSCEAGHVTCSVTCSPVSCSYFSSSNCQFSGALLDILTSLRSLQVVYAGSCKFNGTIPSYVLVDNSHVSWRGRLQPRAPCAAPGDAPCPVLVIVSM